MNQTEAILLHMESGRAITPIDALNEYGCFRLSARIMELRERGHRVIMTRVHNKDTGSCFGSYTLEA